MTSYIGYLCIWLALISNIIGIIFFKLNLNNYSHKKEKFFLIFSRSNLLFILSAFICLTIAYIISDFNNINVFSNSHTDKPLIYKISGVWGNHEGSLLLWILIMSIYTFVFSFENISNKLLKDWTIFFQTIMTMGFILFMIFTSNPFITKFNNFNEGLGLNPILQDPALAVHPPLLYFGYVGFSLILSFAIAGLINNEISKSWTKIAKKYSLFCWSMLTAGITLGALWAYYELGWGGWWFWDPVENASLMPWLSGLALIHSLKVLEKNNQLKRWVIFLSILCFSLSLLGTFLVRSGVLMSVHAFANDASRGIFILILFLIITGFSFFVFLFKSSKKNILTPQLGLNKTSTLIINNIIMSVVCFTVLLGTIYPLIIESIVNERISVGAPYFNSTVIPILLPGLLVMAIAPALSWGKNNFNSISSYTTLFLIILFFLIIIYILSKINPWGIIGIGLSIWIILASILGIYKNIKLIKSKDFIKIISINSSLISHIGVGILILGITVSSIWKKEFSGNLQVGDILPIHKYELYYKDIHQFKEKNYHTLKAEFILKKKNLNIAIINPEKRFYPISKIITTEAGILHQFLQDIYVVIGENNSNGSSVKVYHNPLVSLIWIGAVIIVIGGLLSLRRT